MEQENAKANKMGSMPVSGLAQGLIPIVGYNYGAKDGKRIMESVKVATIMGGAIMAVATVLFLVIPKQMLLMYKATDAMLEIGIPGLRILSVAFIPTVVVLVTGYMFTGLGNGMVNMISTIFRMILPIPIVYILAKALSLNMVWHAFWITSVLAMVYCIIVLWDVYQKKIKQNFNV